MARRLGNGNLVQGGSGSDAEAGATRLRGGQSFVLGTPGTVPWRAT